MLTWNIRGGAWEREWTEHPDGYGLSIDENAKAQLAELNNSANGQSRRSPHCARHLQVSSLQVTACVRSMHFFSRWMRRSA